MDLKQAQQEVAELKEKLAAKYGKEDAYALVTDLAEEVGEISKAVKGEEGIAGKEKEKGKIGMELADAIFSVCALANYYQTDLEEDFKKITEGIEKRFLK